MDGGVSKWRKWRHGENGVMKWRRKHQYRSNERISIERIINRRRSSGNGNNQLAAIMMKWRQDNVEKKSVMKESGEIGGMKSMASANGEMACQWRHQRRNGNNQ
jgi:hypothetical protein